MSVGGGPGGRKEAKEGQRFGRIPHQPQNLDNKAYCVGVGRMAEGMTDRRANFGIRRPRNRIAVRLNTDGLDDIGEHRVALVVDVRGRFVQQRTAIAGGLAGELH